MDEETHMILCVRTDRPSYIEAERRPCSKCNHECWVSPASCEFIAARLRARIICLECAAKVMEPTTEIGILPGSLAEVEAFYRPKERN